jgi:eukaryotic-like serine/threonine-protein kinase
MPLSAGDKLGHYDVLSLLGKGGMGEVYRARDTQLQREVAIKVLPQALAKDPERLARFDREAKILAALNHPNIAVIYGLVDSAAGRALVMELVPGDTLDARIKRGAMPTEEALNVAKQVAEALEVAHEKGVTHRDLKPGNIMITPSGLVKVLDFGLAAMASPAAHSGDPENSPTLTMGMTQAGAIMGTAAYMSPEQAAGIPVDRRADIWSYGVVLWEMLSGQRLFRGDTVAHTLAAVLQTAIDFDKLTAPASIKNLLRRCLDRDVKNRLQWIGEARVAIQKYLTHPEAVATAPVTAIVPHRLIFLWGLAAAVALLAAGLGYFAYTAAESEGPHMITATIVPPPGAQFIDADPPALSPDGRYLAFTAVSDGKIMLWVQELSSGTARNLNGTESARQPFWSYDSKSLAFYADNKLKRIDLAGGASTSLCTMEGVPYAGGAWAPSDVILYSPSGTSSIYRVSARGGACEPLTQLNSKAGEVTHRLPWMLPDGHHFLFSHRNSDGDKSSIEIGDLNSKDHVLLLRVASNAAYANGYILYANADHALMAHPFDPDALKFTGTPLQLSDAVSRLVGAWAIHQFGVSTTGVLTLAKGSAQGHRQLRWFDRSGKMLGKLGEPADIRAVSLSPDGRFAAAALLTPVGSNLWLYDVTRGSASRLTFGKLPSTENSAAWSPDGKTLLVSGNTQRTELRRISAQGGNLETVASIDGPNRTTGPLTWSGDGRYVAMRLNAASATGSDIAIAKLDDPSPKLELWLSGPRADQSPAFGPTSNWLAYASGESGRLEVYIQSFPGKGKTYQISTTGGDYPAWSADGRELFYITPDGKMMAAPLKTAAGSLEVGQPKELFDTRLRETDNFFSFAVSKDGRFLIPSTLNELSAPLTLVLNWPAALKK